MHHLERINHACSASGTVAEITRKAIEETHLAGGKRKLIAAKAGRSGSHDTARRIEEIIRQELHRSR